MFNIPNLFTASNMLCGVIAILLSFAGRIDIAPFFIFAGAVLDFFDGFLARLLKQQGELGKQLDSLADMITFGLAPGIMMLVLLAYSTEVEGAIPAYLSFGDQVRFAFQGWMYQLLHGSSFSWIPFTALVIPFFSMFRLAKFNIDTRQTEAFIGLNTPTNTIFFTAFPLILANSFGESSWENTFINRIVEPQIMIPIIIGMSLLLISEIPFFSLKLKTFKWKGNEMRFLFLISCLLLIVSLMVWAIPFIVLLYTVLSVVENIFFKKKQHEIQS